ncbi:MAG: hypothetical protein CYPHOPRED_004538 [Cyphobasidiales sp. Tagirdzhanova-0007]|nr:MAG: hypothetical protein CYPHOPRED_004538 [Cyphobasidiales sp. Tagirdzhanova-0007]
MATCNGFDAPIGNSLSFGIPLQAVAELSIVYNGSVLTNGQALSAAQVADKPSISVIPVAGANITSSMNFTLMLADASALGNPDAEGDYRHFLANDVHAPDSYNASANSFEPTNGTVITYYSGPGPLVGTGAHRYAWLMFVQPSNFSAPANLSTAGVAPSHWDVQSYVQQSGLGSLIAAAFFTVENGAPTASVISTTAVNTATLSVPSASRSAAGVAGAKSTTTPKSAASSSYGINSGKTAVAMLLAMAGAIAVLA